MHANIYCFYKGDIVIHTQLKIYMYVHRNSLKNSQYLLLNAHNLI